MKKDAIELEGVVVEALPNAMFRVAIETKNNNEEHKVLATLAGKLRMYRIKVLDGDKGKIELSPYDLTRGRIIYRYNH